MGGEGRRGSRIDRTPKDIVLDSLFRHWMDLLNVGQFLWYELILVLLMADF